MQGKIRFRIVALCLIVLSITGGTGIHAQGDLPTISKSVVSSGAAVQAGNVTLLGTVGQPLTGIASKTGVEDRIGFWYSFGKSSTSAADNFVTVPDRVAVDVFPNPFAATAAITYSVSGQASVWIAVYSITGSLVREYSEGVRLAGDYTVLWDGRSALREKLTSGIYYIMVRAHYSPSNASSVVTPVVYRSN